MLLSLKTEKIAFEPSFCVEEYQVKNMFASKQAYNPRAFESFWKPFVRVFQAFCVSHYSIFNTQFNNVRLLYFVVLSILHICLMINILKYTRPHLHIMLNSPHNQNLMFYVSLMGLMGNFLTHTVSHLEPLLTKKHEQKVYKKLQEITSIFATKLNYVMDFNAIRREFIHNTVTYLVFDCFLSLGYSILSIPNDAFNIFVYLFTRIVSITIIRARLCFIAFHVNTLTIILRDLKILLKQQQTNYHPDSNESIQNGSREKIQYLRDVYSNVWLLKNLLSSCFGWSFITFLLELTCELINSSYWVYLNIQRNLMDIRNISWF